MLDGLLESYHNIYKKILIEFDVSYFDGNMYDMSSCYWTVLDECIYWENEIFVDIKSVKSVGRLIDEDFMQSRCGEYVAILFEENENIITGIFRKGKQLNGSLSYI